MGRQLAVGYLPLSQADLQFRALVAGTDSVEVSQWSCQKQMACAATGTIKYKPLNAVQTRELIENLRFTDDRRLPINAVAPGTVGLDLTFRRKGADLIHYTLWETRDATSLVHVIPSIVDASYKLHPRFEKRLRRTLDEVLPRHIRP